MVESRAPTASDRGIIRPLVERILELSERPGEEEKKELWARHNALLSTEKIPVCVTYEGIPARQWDLMFGEDHLRSRGGPARRIEFDLKRRIWMAENVPDDHVVWPAVLVPAVQARGCDWGVELAWRGTGDELGAKRIVAPFADDIELSRLRAPAAEIDDEGTSSRLSEASELVGGRLAVRPLYPTLGQSPFEYAVRMRGMERIFLDLYDTPELVHGMMDFITDAMVEDHRRREERGWVNRPLDPSGRYRMVPRWRHIAAYVRVAGDTIRNGVPGPLLRDEWAYVSAQSSSGLGPAMYDEFVHRYNCRVAELYSGKTVYYHGCECLDEKLDAIATLPNLRRHHVSPWSSVGLAAKKYRGSVVLEVHAHPGKVFFGATRDDMKKEVEDLVAAADGHPMSLNLSDIHSVGENPATLRVWAEAAQEIAAG